MRCPLLSIITNGWAKGCEQHGLALDSVITNASTPHLFEYVQAQDRAGLAEYLNSYIRRMKAPGA